MKILNVYIFIMLMMLITACTVGELQGETGGDSVNIEDEISANQVKNSSDTQAVEREIVCENPYFFPQNTSLITSEILYIKEYTTNTNYNYWLKSGCISELELHWLKQYDNGCLARLSIVPFSDPMPDYMDETRINIYFYVMSDKIYRIDNHDLQSMGSDDADKNDDMLLMSMLDTDEKLVEYGELVCCPEGMEDSLEEGEAGTHTSIEQHGNQVSYNRADMEENGDLDYYENFIWEEEKGLVGYMSGYDAEAVEDTRLVCLNNILYGTTAGMEDREVVCENPYFFPQNVTTLKADITYDDWLMTIEGELELYWLKQYDNGCLARLSVVPFDYEAETSAAYLGADYFHMYFYVTPDEIYRIRFFVSSADRSLEDSNAYINYNDNLLMTVLNTDEKIMEHGELVCSLEEILNDVEEGEEGIYLSIRQEGEQVLYTQTDVTPYNINAWENYCWENGLGLVEYRRGFGAERDPFYITNIIAE